MIHELGNFVCETDHHCKKKETFLIQELKPTQVMARCSYISNISKNLLAVKIVSLDFLTQTYEENWGFFKF